MTDERTPLPLRATSPESRPHEARGLTAIDGALALIAVLLIVQMWLLTAALEAYLAGHVESVLPALIVSAVLFAGVIGLSRFIARVDRDVRKGAVDAISSFPPRGGRFSRSGSVPASGNPPRPGTPT